MFAASQVLHGHSFRLVHTGATPPLPIDPVVVGSAESLAAFAITKRHWPLGCPPVRQPGRWPACPFPFTS
eukprot:7941063-Heterocapsa_arctica.AAC.1